MFPISFVDDRFIEFEGHRGSSVMVFAAPAHRRAHRVHRVHRVHI